MQGTQIPTRDEWEQKMRRFETMVEPALLESYHKLGMLRPRRIPQLYGELSHIYNHLWEGHEQWELLSDLTFICFLELFKEIPWLEMAFLTANYSLVSRNLRYLWESIYHGYRIDSRFDTLDIDGKFERLGLMRSSWRTIEEVLSQVLPEGERGRIGQYRRIWQKLNDYVHPSPELLDRFVVEGRGAALVQNAFNEAWALETIQMVDQVFDAIWLALLSRFPQAAPGVAADEWLRSSLETAYPLTKWAVTSGGPKQTT